MSIKVFTPDDPTTRRIGQALNFSEDILTFPCIVEDQTQTSGQGLLFHGGIAVDRSVFRKRLPDARWFVYAAGLALTSDANTVTLALYYVKDDATTVLLGSTTHTGTTFTKKTLGPFDVFATAGVPAGETVPMVRFAVTKNTAASATVANWNIWLRLLTSKQ